MIIASELGSSGIWLRASGAGIRALGPHDAELEPVLAAIQGRAVTVKVTLWEVTHYDVELGDSSTDRESRRAFALAYPSHVRCAVVPDVYDEDLARPLLEVLAGGIELEARIFTDRRDALDWLREVDPSVPQGVPAWRTSRPPGPPTSR